MRNKSIGYDRAQPEATQHPMLRWTEADQGEVHPQVTLIRKFRQMALSAAILPTIAQEERKKRSHYARANTTVIPFVLSAQGVVGPAARHIFDAIAMRYSLLDVQEQVKYRSLLFHRLSVALIQFACRMGAQRASFALVA